MIQITEQQYEALLADRRWLYAYRFAGVENWDGQSKAIEYFKKLTNEHLERRANNSIRD